MSIRKKMMGQMDIAAVQTPEEIETVKELFREYQSFLKVDLCFQDFEKELAGLPGAYASPEGILLLGRDQGHVCGCAALRSCPAAGEEACEMKRLYVRPHARGRGLGRDMAVRLIREARASGYRMMVLDTLDRLAAAMELYTGLGFEQTDPYYHNPLSGVVYWRLDLTECSP
ncbi:GNAT family N-acetyltransferase [Desulfobotulus sp. H1]|uniref:GNAT family N-acetyltransferase n=1 Tax=Desulfobotulus pelophilus TaxID=2823377 RepID=A0ABT3N9Y0_9BACT|nr:GNAT family N-acetyltransferase [Desulfobotulus pelophilus]MCW7754272.1 GNAT family N-acetyltransferase [Desulfobotulus pelophilus]